ncbi:MAG: hypothetical protein ACTS8Z_06150, partial [Candidatus Limnocylindrales bacterium]
MTLTTRTDDPAGQAIDPTSAADRSPPAEPSYPMRIRIDVYLPDQPTTVGPNKSGNARERRVNGAARVISRSLFPQRSCAFRWSVAIVAYGEGPHDEGGLSHEPTPDPCRL